MQPTLNPYRHAVAEEMRLDRAPGPTPFTKREIASAIGLALAFACSFFDSDLSYRRFGLPILFAASPVLLLLGARRVRWSARLGVVLALLAAVTLRSGWGGTNASLALGVGLVFGTSLVMRSRQLSVVEMGLSLLASVPRLPSRFVGFTMGLRHCVARSSFRSAGVLPIVVPLALVLAFGAVFALANPVIARVLAKASDWAAGLAAPSTVPFAGFIIGLIGSVPLLRPTMRLRRDAEALVEDPDAEHRPASALVVRNALVAVNVLFAGYNLLDVAHLWAGAPPWGLSTQAYAHSGAFWLTVALAMTTTVTGLLSRRGVDPRVRTLAFAWLAQNLVLGLGTYRRISIHVEASGWSSLRMFGIVGTSVALVGIALVAWKLHSARTTMWLVRRQLDAALVALGLFVVVPTHRISAGLDVARVEAGDYRPLVHLHEQAVEAEAADMLLPLLRHKDERVRKGVAAWLSVERQRLFDRDSLGAYVGERRAETILAAHGDELVRIVGKDERDAAMQLLHRLQLAANAGEDVASVGTPLP